MALRSVCDAFIAPGALQDLLLPPSPTLSDGRAVCWRPWHAGDYTCRGWHAGDDMQGMTCRG